jgi:hypothetical protein
MKNYVFNWDIQDSKLEQNVGRLVVYKGLAEKSIGPSRDHNDLLRALAARQRLPKDDVISNAQRFYWKNLNRNLILISPVRKLDEDWVNTHKNLFVNILNSVFDA